MSRWSEAERRLARRWDDQVASELARGMPDRRRWTAAQTVLVVVGVLLVVVDLALVAAGVWLLASWRGPVLAVIGVLAILLAVELRPRLGRFDARDGTAVTPADAPTLWDLVRRTATALGTPDRISCSSVVTSMRGAGGTVCGDARCCTSDCRCGCRSTAPVRSACSDTSSDTS